MDENDKEERGSLTERYKLPTDADDDSKNWASLLDFNSPVEVESDWYTTRTFQVFLDALDINQPTSLNRGRREGGASISNINNSTTPTTGTKLTSDPDLYQSSPSSTNDKIPIEAENKQRNNHFETILSAEALKILSELPDLSHMSVTRSFIFPNSTTGSSATTTPTTAAGKSYRSWLMNY